MSMNPNLSEMEDARKSQGPLGRLVRHKAFVPVVLFLFITILFSFSSQFSDRPPEIESITPEIGVPGDVLIITGKNFGESRSGGEVLIAGTRPVSSSYIEWKDNRISVRIPRGVGSGMVTVNTASGRSRGVLFTNRNHIPVVIEGPSRSGYPYISEVTPSQGPVGTLLHIRGLNFGTEQGQSEVNFSSLTLTGGEENGLSLAACECSFDYEQWRESEIAVRVPDGATSGNITVETDRGTSNSVYFEVTNPVGSKLVGERQGYQLQYGLTLTDVAAGEENWVYFWVPRVRRGLEQTNSETVDEPAPFWNDYGGMNVYHFRNMAPDYVYEVSQTAWFDRYAVETKIDPGNVVPYDRERRLYRHFTSPDDFVPSDHERLSEIATSRVRWENNPYRAAESLYGYVVDSFEYSSGTAEGSSGGEGIDEILDSGIADSYGYAVVYCALLRNAGIPARPVSGLLVYGDKRAASHHWVEFYLEEFGWVPVDPVLGANTRFEDIPAVENPREYYFGNLDNRHIAFSKGILEAIRIKPDGKIVRRKPEYALQTIHEEVSPGIRSYRVVWQKPRVVDWW